VQALSGDEPKRNAFMSHLKNFARNGHPPTLISAFLYFDVSFMVWVILGPLGAYIADDLHLSPARKGLLTAIPLLGGSLFRLVLGPLADRYGGRRVGLAGMLLTLIPLLFGWLGADSLPGLWMTGLLLGVAGASFAVALPLASRWYPPEHQGLALGIAGAGNSGTLLSTLFAPRLAEIYGWHAVFGMAMVPVLVVTGVFYLFAKDSPNHVAPARLEEYLDAAKQPDARILCFFYSLTFGGFVGLASFLSLFFHDQYGVSKVASADLTTLCVFSGSFVRPVGGYLADRLGGARALQFLFAVIGLLSLAAAQLPPAGVATGLFFLLMAALGLGNGSVFQLVSQRFSKEIGVVTGLVGAAGGLGGFFLPSLLGMAKSRLGSFSLGFYALGVVATCGFALLFALKGRWEKAVGTNDAILAAEDAAPDGAAALPEAAVAVCPHCGFRLSEQSQAL
jgi:NNP family nitrate/nitrite transporter-like MFS transporter